MVQDHDVFKPPSNPNQKIWRYLDFTKFVDFLNTESLFFSRADMFEDIFEGSITKQSLLIRNMQFDQWIKEGRMGPEYTPEFWHKNGEMEKRTMAINCWHMNDVESAAMWKLYVKSHEGIAIQSTYSRLRKSLLPAQVMVQIGVVKYLDYEKDFIPYGNGFEPFVHKRKSFEHERELRCLIWQMALDNAVKVDLSSGGIKVPLPLSELIENVYVSPDSPSWFTSLVKDIARRYGITVPIINSRLDERPIY